MTAWAEDRAPWRHDPSADPGAKTEGGRHDAALSFPFGIGTKAANRFDLFLCTLYLISQPRFLHFTLNHYNPPLWQGILGVLCSRKEIRLSCLAHYWFGDSFFEARCSLGGQTTGHFL